MTPGARYRAFFAATATLLLAACASTPAAQPVTTPPASAAPAPSAASAIELPAGTGRTILQTHCTWCHDLREVTKFRGYYDRRQWRDIVVTMVEYGAAVKDNDVEALADYLNEHFGRR
jgi:cytochrome c5